MPVLQMYLIQSLFIFLFGIILLARGQKESRFTNPSANNGNNPVWALGDKQVISWETTLPVFNVTIWQQSLVQESAASQGNLYSKIHDTDQVANFTWVVQLYGFDLEYSNVFFLWMNPDGPNGFVSGFFNITESTKTTTATTTGTDAPATNTLDLDPTTLAASKDAPSSGLPTTGKVALGVGIGIGVPILGALFALVWLKARQPSNNKSNGQVAAPSYKVYPAEPEMDVQRVPQSPKEVRGPDPRDFYPELPGQQDQ